MTKLAYKVAIYAVALVVSVGSYVAEAGQHTPIEQAVQNTARPDADRERDAGRKPAQVLEFLGIEPGMNVVDLYAGGGYFTRLFSSVVGPEGHVTAHYSFRVPEERRPGIVARWQALGNTSTIFSNPEDLNLPDNSADIVLLSLIFHHWHYAPESGEAVPAKTRAALANLLRILKPGGTFSVIEHLAPDGTGREASAATHRVPAEMAKADITAAGFIFDGESDVHSGHPEDDIATYWRDKTPRGQTNRLVQRYRKPE